MNGKDEHQTESAGIGLPGNVITHRYVWRKAIELAMTNSTSPEDATKWRHQLAAYDETFDRLWQLIESEMRWPDPQQVRLDRQLDKLCSWKHLMSYSDAYFGEPEGELKATVYEIDRSRSVCGQCGHPAGSRKGCTLCRDIVAARAHSPNADKERQP